MNAIHDTAYRDADIASWGAHNTLKGLGALTHKQASRAGKGISMSTTSSQDRAAAGTAIRRAVAVVTGVFAAALISASPAVADDSAFLSEVKMNGSINFPESKALNLGHGICNDLQSGISAQAIYQNVAVYTAANRTGIFIGSAIRNLCPDQMPTWQAWVNSRG